jgi:hypothetical protein
MSDRAQQMEIITGIALSVFVAVAQKMKTERQIQLITIPIRDVTICNPSPKAFAVSLKFPLKHVLLTVTVEDILIVIYI